jgi:hypothetical protein
LRRDDHLKRRGTHLVSRIRGGKWKRRQARVGAPDPALTPNAGLAAISELCDRLGVIGELDAAVGPVKQRNRGYGAGERWPGWRRRSWPGKTSSSAWTASARMRPGSSWCQCRG